MAKQKMRVKKGAIKPIPDIKRGGQPASKGGPGVKYGVTYSAGGVQSNKG